MPTRGRSLRAIVVLGDISVDILGAVERWPEPGDDCSSPHLALHVGGVGANCALALSRWKVPAKLVGCVGHDEFGTFLRRVLRESGVETSWIQTSASAMTGLVYISVTPDGQRTFFGSRGANCVVRKPSRAFALFHNSASLHLVGYNFLDPLTETAARYLLKSFRERGSNISLDVGPAASKTIPRKILQLASQVDILFANRSEALVMTQEHEPRNALRSLVNAGARDVVLKLGAEGCMIFHEGKPVQVPAMPVTMVDSTGAGDAFVAAFLQARLRGWSHPEAALAANAAGAAAATVLGAGENLPELREIARVLQNPLQDLEWDAVRRSVLGKMQAIQEQSGKDGRKK